MEKLLFRKLITDICLRALIITFTLGVIVWIVQAVNYLDFVIDDGHNFRIYFFYNLFNFPKIVHRILPFVLFISIFFELIKYERNNELLIFWINGISKKNFILNLAKFSLILMFLQIIIGSIISPSSQFKSRLFLKESNMDFLPNLIKQGKFIDTISGLTIFINERTTKNSYKNIYIQEGNLFDLDKNNQIIFAKEGFLFDDEKKVFRLLNGKIISTNNEKLISFQFDKIDYDLSKFSSKTITVPKIQELSSLRIIKCSFSLMTNNYYQDKMFDCNIEKLKNLNNELYKRFIKPVYIPVLTLICCFLIIFSKEQNNYTLKTIKVFLSVFLILVISETLMRYVGDSIFYLLFLTSIPIILYIIGFIFLTNRVRYG
jgi:lipopolysaccharide export system permease protein